MIHRRGPIRASTVRVGQAADARDVEKERRLAVTTTTASCAHIHDSPPPVTWTCKTQLQAMGTDSTDQAAASAPLNSQTAASSAQPALSPSASSSSSSQPAAAPADSIAASKGAAPTTDGAAPSGGAGEGKAQEGGDGDASAASDQQRDEDELLGTETDEVVDMEVFNQLLEIVSSAWSRVAPARGPR